MRLQTDELTSTVSTDTGAMGGMDAVARRIEQVVVSRKVRDAKFRETVCSAYAYQCAVTGLRLTDDAGLSESQAAHIS